MTAYKDFVSDFPKRCLELLEQHKAPAKLEDKEVTLSLALASCARLIPFERLCPSNPNHVASDRKRDSVSTLGRLLGESSASWPGLESWRQLGPLNAAAIRGRAVEEWFDPTSVELLSNDKTVGSALSVLRNALAHGTSFPMLDRPGKSTRSSS
jgi:hypothetical protein